MLGSQVQNLSELVAFPSRPNAAAIIEQGDTGETCRATFAEVERETAQIAAALTRAGYQQGASVALLARNSMAYILAYLGIMRAGMVAVPVNWRQTHENILHCIRDSDARLILSDGVADVSELNIATLPLGGDLAARIAKHAAVPLAEARHEVREQLAMILYTSGSSGRPKGVELSHRSQLHTLGVFEQRGADDGMVMSIAAPLYHMNALFQTTFALMMGMTSVVFRSFDARQAISAIEQHGITWLTGVPTMYALIMREEDLLTATDLSSVQMITVGSSPLTQGLVQQVRSHFPNAKLSNAYGTTEAGPAVFSRHPEGVPTPALSVGVPGPCVETRLVGGEGADIGTLHVRTPALFSRYRNLPEKTTEVLKDGWYNTGDRFRRDEKGFHFFAGRADDMFVVNGENVHPSEIERILASHPAISEACVVPVPDPVRGAAPVAYVTGGDVSEEDLQDFYRARGRAVETPRKIVFLKTMPLASTNKPDRKTIAEKARDLVISDKR